MQRGARRWVLVGNDYVWPRASHAQARRFIGEFGGSVVGEAYLPLGTEDFDYCLDRLATLQADGVRLSLVGQDAIAFNRAFGERCLHRRLLRRTLSIAQTSLFASGGQDTHHQLVASGLHPETANKR